MSPSFVYFKMTNSTVPKKYKNEFMATVTICKHSIIGAGSIIMPGVKINQGSSIGANSLLLKSTKPWSIYAGSPAIKIKGRKRDLLELEKEYLDSNEPNE